MPGSLHNERPIRSKCDHCLLSFKSVNGYLGLTLPHSISMGYGFQALFGGGVESRKCVVYLGSLGMKCSLNMASLPSTSGGSQLWWNPQSCVRDSSVPGLEGEAFQSSTCDQQSSILISLSSGWRQMLVNTSKTQRPVGLWMTSVCLGSWHWVGAEWELSIREVLENCLA